MRVLTDKEKEAVKQLREKVGDLKLNEERNSDDYLVRWLKARDYNLQKAEEMLRNSMKWREANNADSILDWQPPEIYFKMYPQGICGYTEQGIPVAVFPSRFFDIDLFWEMDIDEYIRYCFRNIELVIEANRKRSTTGMSTYEFIGIYDVGELNLRSLMNRRYLNFVQGVSKLLDENYPELLSKAYFVYTPSLFSVLAAMVRPFIPKRTVAKFVMCGSDPNKIRQHLSAQVPVEVLPPRYGGLNQEFEDNAFKHCGRKSVSRKLSAAGEIIETDGFSESLVPAGQKIDFTFDIEEPKTSIKWCFKTENYDIGFSINYTKGESKEAPHPEPEVIHKFQRVNSDAHKQSGTTLCEHPGKYIFVFDNTYSRMRSKKLHFKVDLIHPSVAETS